MTLNENPTRENIIMLLKKHGPMPIEELSKELNITSMGIRQHLLSLERKGLIDYVTNKKGIGRPAFLYKLTQNADNLFPKAYHTFIVDTLKDIENNEGREKVDELFKWRRMRLTKDTKDVLGDKTEINEKVYGLKNMLEIKGYITELDESADSFILKEYNCPIFQVASAYTEACEHELQFYREILGKEVKRQECLTKGNTSCTYIIPKK